MKGVERRREGREAMGGRARSNGDKSERCRAEGRFLFRDPLIIISSEIPQLRTKSL